MSALRISRLKQAVFWLVPVMIMVGCGKGDKPGTENQANVPAIDRGDNFTIVDAKGASIRIFEAAYSDGDPIPTAYSVARANYIPRYYWEDNSGGQISAFPKKVAAKEPARAVAVNSRKLATRPAPVMEIEFATGLRYFYGTYSQIYRLSIPGIAVGTYYADENFQFELPEDDEESDWRVNTYLDKVTLTHVGGVGEPVAGIYEYWRCALTCTHQQGEFVATREPDIAFKPQGKMDAPLTLGGAPLILREDLVAATESPSFYRIPVQTAGAYSFDIGADLNIVHAQIFSDAGLATLLCDSFEECNSFTAPGNEVYMKLSATVDSDTLADYGTDRIDGVGVHFQLYQTNFGNSLDTIFDLGNADVIRKDVYTARGHNAYYSINIEPDHYYTLAVLAAPPFYNNVNVSFVEPNAIANWLDCDSGIYSGGGCTFLSGPDQHTLKLQFSTNSIALSRLTLFKTRFKSVGSASEPYLLESYDDYRNGKPIFISEVGTDSSYYKIIVSPHQSYQIDLFDASDSIDIGLYSDASFSNSLGSSSAGAPNMETETTNDALLEFKTLEDQTTLYIKVDGAKATKHGGARFNLSVYPIYKSQGSVDQPVAITSALGSEFVTEVGPRDKSYYAVTLPPNSAIQIDLRYLGEYQYVTGYVYANPNFQQDGLCYMYSSYNQCVIFTGPTARTYYILVNENGNTNGVPIGITVAKRPFHTQGSIAHPLPIGQVPLVSWHGESDTASSYYKVRIGAGKLHRVYLTSLQDDLNLSVYADAAYSQLLCQSALGWRISGEPTVAATPEFDHCEFTSPTGGYVYVRVSGENANLYLGSQFELEIKRVHASEGSDAAPVDLGALPVVRAIHSVGPSGTSIYSATVENTRQYRIVLSYLSDNFQFTVYSGDQFNSKSAICSDSVYSNFGGGGCRVTNSTKLWIEVTSSMAYGAKFAISLAPIGTDEGAVNAPVPLNGPFPLNRPSTVGINTASYYSVGVTPGKAYQIDLAGGDYATLEMYTDSSFESMKRRVCTAPGNTNTNVNFCRLTTAADESMLYVAVRGGTLGARFMLNVVDVLPTPQGTPSAPVAIGSAPFVGQKLQAGDRSYQYSYYKIPIEGATSYSLYISEGVNPVDAVILRAGNDSQDCRGNSGGINSTCSYVSEPGETEIVLRVSMSGLVGSSFRLDMLKD